RTAPRRCIATIRPRGFESMRNRFSNHAIAGTSTMITSTLLVSHRYGVHAAVRATPAERMPMSAFRPCQRPSRIVAAMYSGQPGRNQRNIDERPFIRSNASESIGTPRFAAYAVMNEEQSLRIILAFHGGEPRVVRAPERGLPIGLEVIALGN